MRKAKTDKLSSDKKRMSIYCKVLSILPLYISWMQWMQFVTDLLFHNPKPSKFLNQLLLALHFSLVAIHFSKTTKKQQQKTRRSFSVSNFLNSCFLCEASDVNCKLLTVLQNHWTNTLIYGHYNCETVNFWQNSAKEICSRL